ncbi:hypothetical protein PYCC9005_001956 [Savitreella phatthalungensis]
MPAVTKQRGSKHAETPYSRKARPSARKTDEDVNLLAQQPEGGLLKKAAQGLSSIFGWVWSTTEQRLPSLVEQGAAQIRRHQPQRSDLSQLEDGVRKQAHKRSESLLAPDLVPHYLGKTPKVVRQRRQSEMRHAEEEENDDKPTQPNFQVPKFDASQFKLPVLPSPPQAQASSTTRGRVLTRQDNSITSLEISADSQTRKDRETLSWLAQHNIRPEDLSAGLVHDIDTDDHAKLDAIMRDAGFFRRHGLYPPIVNDRSRSRPRAVPDTADTGVMSVDTATNDRAPARRVSSKNWQTKSSAGIISAWRDVCQAQSEQSRARAIQPTVWHSNVSFTGKQRPASSARITSGGAEEQVRRRAQDAAQRYWNPIDRFPAGQKQDNSDIDMHSVVSLRDLVKPRGASRHSRQASLARRSVADLRGESQRDIEVPIASGTPHRQPQRAASRQHTPAGSVASQRRPRSLSRAGSRAQLREQSQQPPLPTPQQQNQRLEEKPPMVTAEVQTEDEVTAFLNDTGPAVSTTPTVTKDRRKRPGCFSALDEDMEERFGPYSDVPTKRSRLGPSAQADDDDNEDFALLPRQPLIRDDTIRKLRQQEQRELEALASKQGTPISITNIGGIGGIGSGQFNFGAKPVMESTPAMAKTSAPRKEDLVDLSDKPAPSFNFAAPATGNDGSKASTPTFSFGANKSDANSTIADGQKPSILASASKNDLASQSAPQTGFGSGATAVVGSATGGFSFGKTQEQTQAADKLVVSTPAFNFGPKAATSAPDASKPFTFATQAGKTDDEPTQKPASSGFSFGSTAGNPLSAAVPAQQSSGFSFGVSAKKPAETPGADVTKPAAFKFGTTSAATSDNADKPTSGFLSQKPETEKPVSSTTVPSFSFGAKSSESANGPSKSAEGSMKADVAAEKPSGGFSFDAPAKADPPAFTGFGSSSSIPAFGSGAPAPSTEKPATSGFTFGSNQQATTAPASAPGDQAASTPAFGEKAAPKPMSSTTPFGATSAAPASGFSFGSTSNNATSGFSGLGGANSATTSFGNAPAKSDGAEKPAAPSGFSFGSTSSSAQPAANASKDADSNVFGSTAQSSATPAFSFGQSAQGGNAPSGGPAFSFGNSNTALSKPVSAPVFGGNSGSTGPAPAFGAAAPSTASTATPAFSFGSSTQQPPAQAQNSTSSGFSFPNNFSAQGQTQPQPASASAGSVFGSSGAGQSTGTTGNSGGTSGFTFNFGGNNGQQQSQPNGGSAPAFGGFGAGVGAPNSAPLSPAINAGPQDGSNIFSFNSGAQNSPATASGVAPGTGAQGPGDRERQVDDKDLCLAQDEWEGGNKMIETIRMRLINK